MHEEQKTILYDVIDALEGVIDNIKEEFAKYEIHPIEKEKVTEIIIVVNQIKTILNKLGYHTKEIEYVYATLLNIMVPYDMAKVSKVFENEIFPNLEKTSMWLRNIIEETDEKKREIKVKYIDFYPEFKPEEHWLYKILKKRYNVVFSEKPDYLFYSCFGNRYLQYNCIRVFISNEAVYPNFNLCDYAVSYADFKVTDRFLPNMDAFENLKYKQLAEERSEAEAILGSKTEFCNYVYSNGNGDPYRTELFHAISKYCQVVSGGGYLNNLGYRVDDLEIFQKKFKFTIACENSFYKGYTTEKIVNAINAKTIPIYWGNENISNIINSRAIINCHEYDNIQSVVEEIIRLDQDDEAYIEKLMQPMLVNNDMVEDYLIEREKFVYNIIEQPYHKAFRRNRCLRGQWYNDWFCYMLGYPNEWFSENKNYFIKKKKEKRQGALVSVLIPVYNRKNIVKDAVYSALNQTWDNIEIIIVDNCSTDGTYEELINCFGNYSNVKIYQNEKNIGPVNNWIRCLEKARGKYVKILWSDDMIKDTFIEKCIDIMEEDPSVGVVFSSCFVFMDDNKNEGFYLHNMEWETGKYNKQMFYKGMFQDEINLPVSPGCAMFRREDVTIMRDIPNDMGINCNVSGAGIDLMIFLLALNKCEKFYYFKEVLSFFRYHSGSITAKNNLVREYNLAKVYYCRNYSDSSQYLRHMQMRILRDEGIRDAKEGMELLIKYKAM